MVCKAADVVHVVHKYNEYKKSLGFSHPHSLPCLPTG